MPQNPISQERTLMSYLTDDEVKAFFAAIPPENLRDELIFRLMLKMGLRVGEVVGEGLNYWTRDGSRVNIADVPDEVYDAAIPNKSMDGYIHVISGIPGVFAQDIDWTDRNLFVRGKGDKVRVVPIPKGVFELLMRFVEPHKRTPNGRLILASNKKLESGITPMAVRKICNKVATSADIGRHIHPHQFRHTFAVRYLKAGGNIRILQRLLGHASLATTEKYLQYIGADVTADMKKVDAILEGEGISREKREEITRRVARTVLEGLE